MVNTMTTKLAPNSLNPAKLAAAILVKCGEITFAEINALPFVNSEDEALIIVDALRRNFDVEFYDRKIKGTRFDCDNVIRLVSNPLRGRAGKVTQLSTTR